MIDDTERQPAANENGEADAGAIKDEGWAKVDLHEQPKTPEADVPSDVERPA